MFRSTVDDESDAALSDDAAEPQPEKKIANIMKKGSAANFTVDLPLKRLFVICEVKARRPVDG